MKLFVPEIGTEIYLLQDWIFNLAPEYRNEKMGLQFGHYMHPYDSWVDSAELPMIREKDYEINYPTYDEVGKVLGRYPTHEEVTAELKRREAANPQYVAWNKEYKEWDEAARDIGKQYLQITLPKGTLLKVDRIYIRKGSGDYSSITFYAKDLLDPNHDTSSKKKPKKRSIRFWASLNECNKIEFYNDQFS